jgi:type II restriction/modification system DNA methylase subunit YeeA
MDVNQFIDKWSRVDRTERQAAQEHFIDLCRVLGEPTPNEAADPGAYSFEKGASKIDGSPGFADVWKRGHFGWEYKKDRANLDRAYQQLQLYSVALENPPLLVVSDTKRFRIYTNWTNTVQAKHEFVLEDLAHSGTRELLRNVFDHPDRLKPNKTREQVTKEAAKDFTTIAERLRMSGHAPDTVAHFLNRLVFCLFAEDVNLLENDLFTRMLDNLAKRRDKVAEQSQRMFTDLFREMRGGGNYGLEHILHFNGGLFDDDTALPLDPDSLDILRNIAKQDWSAIDPSIFGTLFERFLDPDKRAQIGAHYTDPEKIMMIVNPVIVRPLTAEWEAAKAELTDILSKNRNKNGSPGKVAVARAEARLDQFLKRLDDVRILDPACGSGNFLYLALQSLKDLERRAVIEAHEMGLALRVIHCGPHNVKGIEINPYAAELARTAIWIGNIQWLRRNGFEARKEPVLENLDAIECRDALVTRIDAPASPSVQSSPPGLSRGSTSSGGAAKKDVDGRDKPGHDGGTGGYVEAEWPEAEFIVGNPPFLGIRLMRGGLGDDYVETLFHVFEGRVSRESDLVIYWFEKSRAAIALGKTKRTGLVATNSIRSGSNRRVLDHVTQQNRIFDAWSDEPWIVDGAAVRVSLICFGSGNDFPLLDGKEVDQINADLTSGSLNFTHLKRLRDNDSICFMGDTKGGPFDIAGELARSWLQLPHNPNSRPNADVLRPWRNGQDISKRPSDKWLIDFGWELSETEAALFEEPFQYIKEHVLPERSKNRRDAYRVRWWRHVEPRPALRTLLRNRNRYLLTPRVSKHRLFVWSHPNVIPDSRLFAFAKSDDTFFGVLHSRFHEAWTYRTCSWHGVGNDPTYNSAGVFETFPFPEGLTPNIPAADYAGDPRAIAIAKAAKRLDELRNAWLNPPDLIDIVPEVVPGYPDRILPKTEEAAAILKKRTLTNLYNQRPQWLADAHRDLDAAVAAAYGWPADISEEDALAKLLELNLSRTSAAAEPAFEEEQDDSRTDSPRVASTASEVEARVAKGAGAVRTAE